MDNSSCAEAAGSHGPQLPKLDVGSSTLLARSFEVRHGEANEAYHADREHWSCSQIKDFIESPSYFHRRHILRCEPSPYSESMARGTLVHLCFELGWDAVADRIKVIPAEHLTGTGLLSTKSDSKKWVADQGGDAILVTPQDADFLGEVQSQCTLNKAVAKLLDSIDHKEVSIRWTRGNGTKLRCRPDAITNDGRVVDYKTTKYRNPAKDFWRACKDYMYGLQSALYQEGAAAAGFSDEPLIFVLISTASPCVIAKTLPQRFIDLGKTQLDRALADLSARMSFGDWTPDGYGSIDELYMPEFCFKDYQGGDA